MGTEVCKTCKKEKDLKEFMMGDMVSLYCHDCLEKRHGSRFWEESE